MSIVVDPTPPVATTTLLLLVWPKVISVVEA